MSKRSSTLGLVSLEWPLMDASAMLLKMLRQDHRVMTGHVERPSRVAEAQLGSQLVQP